MSAIDSLLKSIRQVILMESKLQQLADGLKDVSQRVIDHEGRLIRMETLVEMAQRRSGPPQIDEAELTLAPPRLRILQDLGRRTVRITGAKGAPLRHRRAT